MYISKNIENYKSFSSHFMINTNLVLNDKTKFQ